MLVHPSLRILACIALVVQVNVAFSAGDHFYLLVILGVLLCAGLVFVENFAPTLQRLVVSSRWIIAVSIVLLATTTPGLKAFSGTTREGLILAFLSTIHILNILMVVALLLATTNQQGLLSGFYFLLQPLRYIGVSPEKLASRISLVLLYCKNWENSSISLFKDYDGSADNFLLREKEIVWSKDLFSLYDIAGILLIILLFLRF